MTEIVTESNLDSLHPGIKAVVDELLQRSFGCVRTALARVYKPEFLEICIEEALEEAGLSEGKTVKVNGDDYRLLRFNWYFGSDCSVCFDIEPRSIAPEFDI